MSRASRITEVLTNLVRDGVISAFSRMDGGSQTRWLIQIGSAQHYYTSKEAEAFIAGVEALRSYAII